MQDDKEFAEKVLAQLEETQVDEDELIEQRRRKRLELQKKLKEEKHAAGICLHIFLSFQC